jgi:hypothetical protein
MNCLYCLVNPTKEAKNKYCSCQCGYDARRRIDPEAVRIYQARGLNATQIAELIPATPGAIRNSVNRIKRACKRLNASSAGNAMALTAGSIQTGSTA